ncbi:DUF3995 domain-containing protein [Kitasatospora paracochleata]|uniref:DUF3995 domain-containing protein n=1 Tax=Kitasatospora paracochleata TaxID=58354 RepID=A0ABT1IZS2_9ACTN|nr:DUF3995 domain-containing protein [Kitasatospora paracochleata]MCP2310642.1 hypothetical protein [Kitasatospora paracochleata]
MTTALAAGARGPEVVRTASGAIRVTGGAVSAALAGIGGLHAVWARSPWPLKTRADFADAVVGVGEEQLPGPALCLGVAGLLGAASYLVGARAGVLPATGPAWLRAVGAGTVGGVLVARGLGGPALAGRDRGGRRDRDERSDRFRRLDRRYYSPLCVALGAGAAVVAVRGR